MRASTGVARAIALAGALIGISSAFAVDPVPSGPCADVPLVHYKMNEASWNGTPGEVLNSGSLGAALNGTAACDNVLRPGCAFETPRPPKGLPSTMLSTVASPNTFFNAAGQRYSMCGRSGYFNWGKVTIGLQGGQYTVINNYRQHVNAPNSLALNDLTSTLTITAWVNPYHRAPGGYYFTIIDRGSQFKLSLRRGYLTAEWLGTGGVKRTVSSTTTVDLRDGDPVWHHVAFTFNVGEARLYIDGKEVAGYQDAYYQPYLDAMGDPTRPSFAEVLIPVAEPLQVGYTSTFESGTAYRPQGDAYRGLMDDVRIYAGALGAAPIKAIAASRNCSCVGP